MKTIPQALQGHNAKKSRRRLTSRQRGVAIITVLAVIVLMAALVLSFFQMAKNEQVSSKVNADILRSYSLRDVAINIAIGQIREATAPTTSALNANRLWTSQPGLIRTFDKDGNNGPLYKLYSAKSMWVDGNGAESAMLNEDSKANWRNDPVGWVDLNQPVFRAKSTATSDSTQAATKQGSAIYPIIDPSAYKPGRTEADPNPEGFSYTVSQRFNGVDPDKSQLPMPVRWLYTLQDGTVGYMSDSGEFQSSATASKPSDTNPIVGRIAFWTDDESCKININTASEGVFWDTPRCDTPEERFYANCQPTAGEYQRFPGHPAGVCLSSVLFPKKRFYAGGETGPAGSGSQPFYPPGHKSGVPAVDGDYKAMTKDEISFIWDLAPFVGTKNVGKNPAGTVKAVPSSGNITRASLNDANMKIDDSGFGSPDDHLYTSSDELLFRALKNGTSNPSTSRTSWTTVTSAGGYTAPINEETLITRLNRAKFLLTTKSSAPEVTVFGTPRISLWPVDKDVAKITSGTVGTLGPKFTLFDTIIGLTAQLSSNNYYYVIRNQFNSRHTELYGNETSHNLVLFDYLKRATGNKFPGVPGKNTFLDKFGGSSTSGLPNYSDRNNILLNMLDFIRMTNLNDPLLTAANRYGSLGATNNFPGQVTAYCGCNSATNHASNWATLEEPYPKGVGRIFTPIRMHFVIQKIGKIKADGSTWESPPTFPSAIVPLAEQQAYLDTAATNSGTPPYKGGAAVYEMGVIVEGAAPAQGLTGILPGCSVRLGGGDPALAVASVTSPIPSLFIEDNGADSPTGLREQNRRLRFAAGGVSVSNYANTWPVQYPTWGGSAGIRAFSNPNPASKNSLILFAPFAIADGNKSYLEFKRDDAKSEQFVWDKYMWRLMVFDDSVGSDVNQLIQGYYFNFGKAYSQVNFPLPNNAGPATHTLNQQVADMFAAFGHPNGPAAPANRVARPNGFEPRQLGNGTATVHSLYVPIGDYRGIISRRVLGPLAGSNSRLKYEGVSNTTPDGYSGFWSSFVPTPDFGKQDVKYALQSYDPMTGRDDTFDGANTARPHPAYAKAVASTPKILTKLAEFDYPLPFEKWRHHVDLVQLKQRGSMDPAITGDFDNGIAGSPDGAYTNRVDEGDLRPFFTQTGATENTNSIPYFGMNSGLTAGNPNGWLGELTPNFATATAGAAAATPNRQVRGPVQFGSLPTGSSSYTFWQNLLFRPDPFGGSISPNVQADNQWDNRHYGGTLNANMPKDHLLLDLFWMPVVEPYSISDPFSTKGKINMNYRIIPFSYITRNTALHALLKSEKMLTIPTRAASNYKAPPTDSTNYVYPISLTNSVTNQAEQKDKWRKYINAESTLYQFERKFDGAGEFRVQTGEGPRVFRTASEICELWLIPECLKGVTGLGKTDNPYKVMRKFWTGVEVENNDAPALGGNSTLGKKEKITDIEHGQRLTGDNTKEAPYANLYPRLTTKSNVFKVHFTVQTLQKARSTAVNKFDPKFDKVTSEYRGSAVIERALDMTNPNLQQIMYLTDPDVFASTAAGLRKRLDYFYNYRITEIKQFAP